MSITPAPPSVAILAMPQSAASVIFGMYDLFRSAGRDWNLLMGDSPGPSAMNAFLVSPDGDDQTISNGVTVTTQASIGDGARPDIICVPEVLSRPCEDIRGRYPRESSWLRRCHDEGSIIASVCSGAFLLAEAGLLDGQQATTHWAFSEALVDRYPRVRLREKSTLVVSGEGNRLVMAGGGASCQDLALYLIARFAGIECAIQTARLHLVDWHSVGQQPFAHVAQSRQTDDALIARCQVWVAENYRESAPVASVAEFSGLPERTFKRRFQQATGQTPLEYVQNLRIEEARHLLETGELSIEAIANAVGYEDAGFFARLFKRHVGLTPAQYRRRFGGLRQMLGTL